VRGDPAPDLGAIAGIVVLALVISLSVGVLLWAATALIWSPT
jgi:hypothetical protein